MTSPPGNRMDPNDREILLVYDRECPVCEMYGQMVRIRQSVGDLKIIDAREPSEALDEVTRRGLDIDQGMVVMTGDQLYYGSDAIHALALMGTRTGVFNRLNYWMFRSHTASRLLYPVLRFFRNLLLKLLGKSKINNLEVPGNDNF